MGLATTQGLNGRLVFAIIAGALGSAFQHGYNTGVISNAENVVRDWIADVINSRNNENINGKSKEVTFVISAIASIFCLGGMIGGLSVGFAADKFGRKNSLLLNNILVLIGVVFEAMAEPTGLYEMLYIGRFFMGINAGFNAGLAPMYLSEISPQHLRGAVGTVYQLIITISILVAQILGLGTLLGTKSQWPLLFCLTVVPAIFQLVTLPFCPESPKFLLLGRGKDMDAQRSLSWLRGTIEVHDEMEEMRAEYESMKLIPAVSFKELIMNATLRIPLVIAVMIMLAQQLSGINAIINFSSTIFKGAGLSDGQAESATLGVGAINVFMTVVSLVLVEKAGRKTLLLFGFGGMVIITSLLAVFMEFKVKDNPNWASYSSILFVMLFIVFFASGPGSIPWFLVSELFNQSARPKATSVAIGVNWFANFLVTSSFGPIKDMLESRVFYIFTGLQIIFTLYIYKVVPETKNKSIEEVSSMFRQRSYQ